MEDKLLLLTECERLALPLALFAMQIGKVGTEEQVATTNTTNMSFTRTELEEIYEK